MGGRDIFISSFRFYSNLCSGFSYGIIFIVAVLLLAIVYMPSLRKAGVVDLHSYRMEVMLMNNDFDFKDLMSFGMFLLALLTFIYLICH